MDDPRLLRTFFVPVCLEIRQRRKKSTAAVAAKVGVGEESIKRFEKSKNFPDTNLESYLAAYASLDKVDPRDLLMRMLKLWKELGLPPATADADEDETDGQAPSEIFTPEALIKHIRIAERADEESAPAAKRPTSTRKNRAAEG